MRDESPPASGTTRRRTLFGLSPALVMGFANLPFGLYGGLMLVTAPQLLVAQHVSKPEIASITAAALVPTFAGFLLSPLLDVWVSRRIYAWALGLLTAVLTVGVVANVDHTARFGTLLVAGSLAATLFNIAVGGWLGDIVAKGDEARLAAGFQGGNAAGFGLGAIMFLPVIRALPGWSGALICGLIVATPLALLFRVPSSRRDRLGLHESFATLGRDLAQLVRKPLVRRLLLFFVLPTCGFAMSNTFTSYGDLYHADEAFISVVAGVIVTVIGIGGSLLGPVILKRAPAGWAFLATGAIGAVFTASFLVLPHVPWVVALGISGENGWQSIAFAIATAIIFRSIGDDNPLAATQYALLNSAVAFPTTYMQWVDGQAYAAGGGLNAGLACDAALAMVGALLLAPVLRGWQRRGERAF